MRLPMALLVIGGLALAACGGDDDDGGDVSDEQQPFVDAIAQQFTQTEADELTLTAEQAECVAPRWVDVITVERFEERDVSPEDIVDDSEDELTELGLDEDQANGLVDAFEPCGVDINGLFITTLIGTQGSDTDRECLDAEIDDELVRQLLVASLTDDDFDPEDNPEVTEDLTRAFDACGLGG